MFEKGSHRKACFLSQLQPQSTTFGPTVGDLRVFFIRIMEKENGTSILGFYRL